jgi:hypothetical protein
MKKVMKIVMIPALFVALSLTTACSSNEETQDVGAMEAPIVDETISQDLNTAPIEDTSLSTTTEDVNLGASSSGLGH